MKPKTIKFDEIDLEKELKRQIEKLEGKSDSRLKQDLERARLLYETNQYDELKKLLYNITFKRRDLLINDLLVIVEKELSQKQPDIYNKFRFYAKKPYGSIYNAVYTLDEAISKGEWTPNQKIKELINELGQYSEK